MALPASDAFTGTDSTALQTYSSNWTINAGGFNIKTNAVYPASSGNECGAHWNADAFAAGQYAQATILQYLDADHAVGAAVRCAASGGSYYGYYTSSTARYLFVMSGGSWTELGSAGQVAANDVMRLEVNGTTLTPKINGVTDSTIGAVSNDALAAGYAGVSGYSVNDSTRADNFEGGNLSTTPTYQPRPPTAIDSVFMY